MYNIGTEWDRNGDGDEDATVDDDGDDDDALASYDTCNNKDGALYKFPPSRSLLEVRFMRFLVALNVGSQTRLSMVKVFDDVEPVPYGTPRGTGGPACTTVIIVMEPSSHIALSPRCVKNHLNEFYHFKISYLCPIWQV
jgi:hypothetical protein